MSGDHSGEATGSRAGPMSDAMAASAGAVRPGAEAEVVRRFMNRATGLMLLRALVRWSTAWLLVWGLGVLIARALAATLGPVWWVGVSGLGVVALAAAVHAYRRRPAAGHVRALLDRHNRCGGLLMLEDEQSAATWRERLPRLEAMSLRWRAGRPMAALAVSVAFVAAAFLVPTSSSAAREARTFDLSGPVAELRERMEVLVEEAWIEADEAQMLEADLERLEAGATGDEPTRTWEALDHVRERMEQSADAGAERALTEATTTAQMRVLAEALVMEGEQLDAVLAERAMEELAEMVGEARAEHGTLREQLGERLAERLAEAGERDEGFSEFSEEALSELAERLRERQAAIEQAMRRMAEAELVDAQTLAECEALGTCSGEGFCEFASEHGEAQSLAELVEAWTLGAAGGVADQGGSSPMTFMDTPADGQEARFEPRMLPSERRDVTDSEFVGLGVSAPAHDETAAASGGGVLDGAEADGGRAAGQRVLPRHRQAVHRYFDRAQGEDAQSE